MSNEWLRPAPSLSAVLRPAVRPAGPRQRSLMLSSARDLVLGALLAGEWPVVDTASPKELREASGLVSAFVAWHVDRGLRSLAYVER